MKRRLAATLLALSVAVALAPRPADAQVLGALGWAPGFFLHSSIS